MERKEYSRMMLQLTIGVNMLRHWLVRNGSHVENAIAYVKTNDESPLNQLDQVINGVRDLGWDLNNVYVIEKATSKAHKTLRQFILENI